ncbi:unnamed protein product [Acanthoscelides obtectus]|uniref:Uncharacterized protein n=1 Tax=Acanthoscelides obtectus TaxID=200917 RepID=A0A9P0LUZ7_ACAOB|nr:unnamed protein product [Acanthoscelides obtectus]CAK1680546.1 hypothetical protein AOBTE_LOCUS32747 [Acanthoscelides obtectus]
MGLFILGTTEIFVSKWFAFERMKFLLDKDQPNCTLDTETREMDDGEVTDLNESLTEEENVTKSDNNVTQPNDLNAEETVDSPNGTAAEKPVHGKTSSRIAKEPQIFPKKRKVNEDPKVAEAYKIMKEAQARSSRREKAEDRFDIYGQHIASKLRTYSKRAEIMVEHAINNILFEADLGNYDGPSSGSSFQQHSLVSLPLPSPATSQYTSYSDPLTNTSATESSQPSNNMDTSGYNIPTAQNLFATFNPITYTLEQPTNTSQ